MLRDFRIYDMLSTRTGFAKATKDSHWCIASSVLSGAAKHGSTAASPVQLRAPSVRNCLQGGSIACTRRARVGVLSDSKFKDSSGSRVASPAGSLPFVSSQCPSYLVPVLDPIKPLLQVVGAMPPTLPEAPALRGCTWADIRNYTFNHDILKLLPQTDIAWRAANSSRMYMDG